MTGEQERLDADKVTGRAKIQAGIKAAQKLGLKDIPVGDVEVYNRVAKNMATRKNRPT